MAERNDLPTNEEALFALVQQGNRQAWGKLVAQYYNPIYGFILSMVKNDATAEELVQDIFVNFWAKRERIEINLSLKSYLFRAARNHTLNFLKRKNFEQNYHRGLAETTKPYSNATEQTVQFNELQQKLDQAIESLPENCREIFKLSRFEELTYKEISDALEVPVRTVHYQIGLALKQLREQLKDYYNPQIITPFLLFITWLCG